MDLKSIDARFLDELPVGIGISDDKFALIFFPDKKGNLDYSSGFILTSDKAISLIIDIWDYYWLKGRAPDYTDKK